MKLSGTSWNLLLFAGVIVLTVWFSGDAQAQQTRQGGWRQAGAQRGAVSYAQRRRLPAVQVSYSNNFGLATTDAGAGGYSGQSLSSRPGALRNGLPVTSLDSFVLNAGAHKEHIYGDEGADGIPPYMGFNRVHRINTGILGDRDAGLTTGHGSYMPEAWGADEFIAPPGEWSVSGANHGDHNYNNASAALDASDQQQGLGGAGPGQLSASDLAEHPSPGPGYQPMFQHGVFVGWYSPEEVALSQTDFAAALRSIVNSDRYWGGESGKNSILYEIGDRSSPF